MDPTTAVEAFVAFSQRAPGFVSDEDCLNKFAAMDEGTFEDPLGLLVCKGQDGGLVLPLKPKAAQGSTTEPNSAQVGIERVEEELRRALDGMGAGGVGGTDGGTGFDVEVQPAAINSSPRPWRRRIRPKKIGRPGRRRWRRRRP